MAENLAYAPYLCPLDSQCGIWIYDYSGTGSYGQNYHLYGCLYDWETALEICPEGWHLPSDEEWMELELFLGMEYNDLEKGDLCGQEVNVGGKLKETGTLHWLHPNIGATNETGFSALPGGMCFKKFYSLSEGACFWTSSEDNINRAFTRIFFHGHNGRERMLWNKDYGLSIRCIKN